MSLNVEAFQNRAAKQWSTIAKEPVKVEVIGGTIYAFGSELACLRIHYEFRYCDGVHFGYSENLKSHYFSKPKRF